MADFGDYIDFPLRLKTVDLLNLQRDINTHHKVHNQIFESLNTFLRTGILSNGKVPTIGSFGPANAAVAPDAAAVGNTNPAATPNVPQGGAAANAAVNAIIGAVLRPQALAVAALGGAQAALGGAQAVNLVPALAPALAEPIQEIDLRAALNANGVAAGFNILHSDARPFLLALGWNASPILGVAALAEYNRVGFNNGIPQLYGGRRTRRRRNKKTNNRGRRFYK